MKKSISVAAFGLLIVGLLAGCSYVPQGEEVEVGYVGPINSSGGQFQMDGHLSSGGGSSDKEQFRHVTVQLYAADGTLLCEREVGSLDADSGHLNVSVTADVVPQYVVFTSPDFWSEQTHVSHFEQSSGGEYNREYVSAKSELPVSIVDSSQAPCSE